jgi:hypothetical protein
MQLRWREHVAANPSPNSLASFSSMDDLTQAGQHCAENDRSEEKLGTKRSRRRKRASTGMSQSNRLDSVLQTARFGLVLPLRPTQLLQSSSNSNSSSSSSSVLPLASSLAPNALPRSSTNGHIPSGATPAYFSAETSQPMSLTPTPAAAAIASDSSSSSSSSSSVRINPPQAIDEPVIQFSLLDVKSEIRKHKEESPFVNDDNDARNEGLDVYIGVWRRYLHQLLLPKVDFNPNVAAPPPEPIFDMSRRGHIASRSSFHSDTPPTPILTMPITTIQKKVESYWKAAQVTAPHLTQSQAVTKVIDGLLSSLKVKFLELLKCEDSSASSSLSRSSTVLRR